MDFFIYSFCINSSLDHNPYPNPSAAREKSNSCKSKSRNFLNLKIIPAPELPYVASLTLPNASPPNGVPIDVS